MISYGINQITGFISQKVCVPTLDKCIVILPQRWPTLGLCLLVCHLMRQMVKLPKGAIDLSSSSILPMLSYDIIRSLLVLFIENSVFYCLPTLTTQEYKITITKDISKGCNTKTSHFQVTCPCRFLIIESRTTTYNNFS